jgi:hypothetical protein
MLRDMPEAASLSSGERRDEHTWALRLADLDDLHLSLREDTPDTFDVIIEVASAAGAQIAATVAHVRLLDAPQAAAPPRTAEASFNNKPPAEARAVEPAKAAAPRGAVARPKPALEAGAAAPLQERGLEPRAPRLEGASALGGPVGDAAAAPAADGRQMWWKMPSPAWTPFADGPARR